MIRRLGTALDKAVVSLGIIVSGLILIAISWLGVSGRAEVEEQLPWILVGVSGLLVLVIGAALLALRHVRSSTHTLAELERDIARLHGVAIADSALGSATQTPGQVMVAPDGGTFHREDCRLVADKEGAAALTVEVAEQAGHVPCLLCEPLGERTETV